MGVGVGGLRLKTIQSRRTAGGLGKVRPGVGEIRGLGRGGGLGCGGWWSPRRDVTCYLATNRPHVPAAILERLDSGTVTRGLG